MVFRRPAALAVVFLTLPAATGFDWGGVFGGSPAKSDHATDELQESNFEDFLKQHPVSAILFYAPWCFYSQQIMPSWDTAAQKLMLHDPPVHLAKIDAHKYSAIGDRYEVSGFPTMKLFIDGTVMEYDQDLGRSWQAMVKWVNRHIDRDHILKTAEEADSYLNDNDLTVIGLFPDEEMHPSFLKSARHFSDVMFAEARGASVAKEVAEHLAAHASLTCQTVKVGKSSANEKATELPREHMHCSSTPRNPQRPEWTDKYEATVVGKEVKVKRLDEAAGWDQNLQLKCCDDETHGDKDKHAIPVPSVVMFMPHDERFAIYDGDLTDIHALDRWIMARRRPMIMHLSESNADKVSEVGPEHIPGLFLIGNVQDQAALDPVLQKAGQRLRGRVFICVSGRSTMLERRLATMAGIEEESSEAVLTLIDMHPNAAQNSPAAQQAALQQQQQQHSHHGARKYRLNVAGLTEDAIVQFVTDYEQGRLKPWLKSEPEPSPEDLVNEPVGVLVGTTFAAAAQEEAKDVFIDMYAPWCGHCRKLEPLYKALAKKLKHVKTLNIMKIDATRNELEDMVVQGYPTIVLFPAGTSPKTPVQYHGDRSPDDMTRWLVEHCTHKFDPKPPAVPVEKAVAEPVASGLLDPSEEDL